MYHFRVSSKHQCEVNVYLKIHTKAETMVHFLSEMQCDFLPGVINITMRTKC